MAWTRAQYESSLAKWRERETRFRKNWRSKKKGDPRRFYWYTMLVNAKAWVARREREIAKLGVTSVSSAGLDLIKEFEGFSSKPYKDPVGVWTIGYGETRGVGPKTKPITKAAATKKLETRVDRDYLKPVLAYCRAVGFKPTQHEADALVSLAYNVGPGVFARGRTMGDAVASHDRKRVAQAFLVYDKADGRPLAGLTRRRKAEKKLFES